MGLRFRKSAKIAPGVRVSFGKNSASVSIGGKGGRYTVSSTGRRTTSVGVPGSGLSYVSVKSNRSGTKRSPTVRPARSSKSFTVYGVILLIIAAIAIILGLVSFSVGGWFLIVVGVLCLIPGVCYFRKAKVIKLHNAEKSQRA